MPHLIELDGLDLTGENENKRELLINLLKQNELIIIDSLRQKKVLENRLDAELDGMIDYLKSPWDNYKEHVNRVIRTRITDLENCVNALVELLKKCQDLEDQFEKRIGRFKNG